MTIAELTEARNCGVWKWGALYLFLTIWQLSIDIADMILPCKYYGISSFIIYCKMQKHLSEGYTLKNNASH